MMSAELSSGGTGGNKLLTGCLLFLAAVVVICVLIGIAVPSIGNSLLQSVIQAPGKIIQLPPPTPTIIVLPTVINQIKPLGQLHTASYFHGRRHADAGGGVESGSARAAGGVRQSGCRGRSGQA
jgi:hypothetical protein